MDSLMEVLRVSVQPVVLPFTLLLVLAALYWLFVCVGLLDMDSANVDVHGHFDGGGSVGSGAEGSHPGFLAPILKFLHIGEAPLMAILSVFLLWIWAFSVIVNHQFNPEGAILPGLGWLVPNVIIGAVATRIMTKPLRVIFKKLSKDFDQHEPIIGQVCVVFTGEVTEAYGQATLDTRNRSLTLQVRTSGPEVLRRGEKALVISEDQENGFFRVIKYQEPKLED